MEPSPARPLIPRSGDVAGRIVETVTPPNVPLREGGSSMPNERLRATLLDSDYDERSLADALSLDPKSVQRWVTRDVIPRRATAHRAARLLGVSAPWL